MRYQMPNPPNRVIESVSAIAAILTLALAGCGTAINSPSSSPPGTIQTQSQPNDIDGGARLSADEIADSGLKIVPEHILLIIS